MKIKNIQLNNFNIANDVQPFETQKNIEVKWFQDDESKRNNQTYASFIGNRKEDINNQLSSLSKTIASERVRTLNNLPKMRVINSKIERIY